MRCGALPAVLQHVLRGVRSPQAVSEAPTGRQLHPEDLQTLLLVLRRLTGAAAADTVCPCAEKLVVACAPGLQ